MDDFDELVKEFKDASDQKSVISKAEQMAADVEADKQRSAKYYVKVMKSIADKGMEFVDKEIERLQRMLEGESVQATKKTYMMIRQNILNAFKE